MACQDAIDGLDARVDQHYAELKALRGKVNSNTRYEKKGAEASSEEIEPAPSPHPSLLAARRRATRGF